MKRDRMPVRNPDPPSRIPLEQTLDHGGPQKTERDKLRLRRWLAAHPSCPYPITYSVALHQALGIADVQYAGALFQRLSRSGLPENCTTERFYLKAVATKNFRFVRLGPLDEGLPVRAVFMASLLHCVDQLRVDQHRLVDSCIVYGVATTEDEKAAMAPWCSTWQLFRRRTTRYAHPRRGQLSRRRRIARLCWPAC